MNRLLLMLVLSMLSIVYSSIFPPSSTTAPTNGDHESEHPTYATGPDRGLIPLNDSATAGAEVELVSAVEAVLESPASVAAPRSDEWRNGQSTGHHANHVPIIIAIPASGAHDDTSPISIPAGPLYSRTESGEYQGDAKQPSRARRVKRVFDRVDSSTMIIGGYIDMDSLVRCQREQEAHRLSTMNERLDWSSGPSLMPWNRVSELSEDCRMRNMDFEFSLARFFNG